MLAAVSLSAQKNEPQSIMREIDSLYNAGKYGNALSNIEKAWELYYDIKRNPEAPNFDYRWILNRWAYCLLAQNNIDKALDKYIEYLIINTDNGDIYNLPIPEKASQAAIKYGMNGTDSYKPLAMLLMLGHSSNKPLSGNAKSIKRMCELGLNPGNGTIAALPQFGHTEISHHLIRNAYNLTYGAPMHNDVLKSLALSSCKLAEIISQRGFYSLTSLLYHEALSQADKCNDPDIDLQVNIFYIKHLIKRNLLEEADERADVYLKKAASMPRLNKYTKELYTAKGEANMKMSLMPEALSCYGKAADLYEKEGDISEAAKLYITGFSIIKDNNLDNIQSEYFANKAIRHAEELISQCNIINNHQVTLFYYIINHYYRNNSERKVELLEKINECTNPSHKIKEEIPDDIEDLLAAVDNLLASAKSTEIRNVNELIFNGMYDEAADIYIRQKRNNIQQNTSYTDPETLLAVANKIAETNTEKALMLYSIGADIYKQSQHDRTLIKFLTGAGDCNFIIGHYQEAYNNYATALAEIKDMLPDINDYYPGIRTRMAITMHMMHPSYDISGDLIDAYEHMAKASVNSLGYTSQSSFENLWENANTLFSEVLAASSLVKNPTPEFQEKLFNSVIFQKNMLYASQKALYIAGNENPQSRETFRKIAAIRRSIDNPDPDIPKSVLDSLYNLSIDMERDLVRGSKLLKTMKDNMDMGFKEIKATLKEGEILVDFAKVQLYREFIQKALPDYCTYDYYAFVFGPKSDAPVCIRLFSQQELEEFEIFASDDDNGDYDYFLASFLYNRNNYTISPTYQSKPLTDFIWGKVLENFADAKTIYFAPDGQLHTIGLEYLSIGDGKCMSDKYNMVRLSHSNKINSVHHYDYKFSDMLLYGGINYTIKDTVKAYRIDTTRTLRSTRQINKSGAPIQYLPGTLSEANNIEKVFGNHIDNLLYFHGDDALEETFKENAPNANIVHVATHGVFFDEAASTKTRSRDILEQGALIFAGSANAKNRPAYIDDGFLTGLEISELNLTKNKLVVLSACETGLGHVNSKGFFGLERAFKIAGSKTIVMSHWTIDDNASYLLMSELYSSMSKGNDPRKALKESIQKLRSNPRYSAPYFWAPFVIID